MDLFETLKELKSIKADLAYTEKSRRVVLATLREKPLNGRLIFFRILEGAGSLALAGILVFAIAGGFSGSRYLSPISFQGIDPAALHAEAQAIDMQINIANLNYAQTSGEGGSTAMIMRPASVGNAQTTTSSVVVPQSTSTAPSSATTSTSSATYSVNDALQQLEQ